MNRSLLTPRWLGLHTLFLAATIATGFLARWQWDRAHEAGGSAQNLGYALMWPLFGAFTVFLWVRVARMHKGTDRAVRSEPETPVVSEVTAREQARKRPLVPPPAPPVDADEDPELAAYNRYLAELDETDRRVS
ncbi:hypothetical protein [Saccharopolyspora taberi]|uniref:hypothetical protein n=1 Tax=Saccharopolyspora taberi TaxID=60895 RepID=UPI0031E3BDF9